jgi:hypothetical protein
MQPPSPVGAEAVTFVLRFSGLMDPQTLPQVTFGPEAPYESYSAESVAWSSTRAANDTLTATATLSAYHPDGTYRLKLSGAQQADGRQYPQDAGYTFEVDTPTAQTEGVWAVRVSERQARVTWQPPCCGAEQKAAGYRIRFGRTAGGPYGRVQDVPGAGATTALVEPLAAAATFYFRVSSYDASGQEGPPSSEVRVGPFQPATVPAGLGLVVLLAVAALGVAAMRLGGKRHHARRR